MFKLNPLFVILSVLTLIVGCKADDLKDADKLTKPTVNAGADQMLILPVNSITLSGTAKSELSIYEIKTKSWRQVSGPQSLTLINADSLKATAFYPTIAGTYIFELSVKDSGGRSNSDQMQVIIQAVAQSMQRAYMQQVDIVAWQYADRNQGMLSFSDLDSVSLTELDTQLEHALTSLNSAAEFELHFAANAGGNIQTALLLLNALSAQGVPICLSESSSCHSLEQGFLLQTELPESINCSDAQSCVTALLQYIEG